MLLDMHTWKEKDLGDIARKMDNIERRLDIARGGPETQRQQREVLNRLDEMIKKLENKNKKNPVAAAAVVAKPGEGECPDGGVPAVARPRALILPAIRRLTAPTPAAEHGHVDQAKFKKLVSDWGRLPPAEQRRALQEMTQGMSPRHREAIVNYFQNLTNPALNRK